MKTILVTGASGNIGSAIIDKLTRENNKVIAIVHNKKDILTPPWEYNEFIEIHHADISNPQDLSLLERTISKPLDWIVCAHGYIDPETILEKQNPDNIYQTFQVNTISILLIAQVFINKTKEGMIVISSTSGIVANGKYPAYSASKAAANSIIKSLARNRQDKKFIAVCPGPTFGKMRERLGVTGGQNPQNVANLVDSITHNSDFISGDIISIRDNIITVEPKQT
jgi:short-subunit dehydrogenase